MMKPISILQNNIAALLFLLPLVLPRARLCITSVEANNDQSAYENLSLEVEELISVFDVNESRTQIWNYPDESSSSGYTSILAKSIDLNSFKHRQKQRSTLMGSRGPNYASSRNSAGNRRGVVGMDSREGNKRQRLVAYDFAPLFPPYDNILNDLTVVLKPDVVVMNTVIEEDEHTFESRSDEKEDHSVKDSAVDEEKANETDMGENEKNDHIEIEKEDREENQEQKQELEQEQEQELSLTSTDEKITMSAKYESTPLDSKEDGETLESSHENEIEIEAVEAQIDMHSNYGENVKDVESASGLGEEISGKNNEAEDGDQSSEHSDLEATSKLTQNTESLITSEDTTTFSASDTLVNTTDLENDQDSQTKDSDISDSSITTPESSSEENIPHIELVDSETELENKEIIDEKDTEAVVVSSEASQQESLENLFKDENLNDSMSLSEEEVDDAGETIFETSDDTIDVMEETKHDIEITEENTNTNTNTNTNNLQNPDDESSETEVEVMGEHEIESHATNVVQRSNESTNSDADDNMGQIENEPDTIEDEDISVHNSSPYEQQTSDELQQENNDTSEKEVFTSAPDKLVNEENFYAQESKELTGEQIATAEVTEKSSEDMPQLDNTILLETSQNKDIHDTEEQDTTSPAISIDSMASTSRSSASGGSDPFSIPPKPSSSVNQDFVDGVDDIGDIFENVDPPDELDPGASGISMQELLIGNGAKIIKTRVIKGVNRVKKSMSNIRNKARRKWLSLKKKEDSILAEIGDKESTESSTLPLTLEVNEEAFEEEDKGGVPRLIKTIFSQVKELFDDLWSFGKDGEDDIDDFDFNVDDDELAKMRQKIMENRMGNEGSVSSLKTNLESMTNPSGLKRPITDDMEKFIKQRYQERTAGNI